ncbi:MAG: cell division protein FtsZ, partial [Rhodovulum sp.]
YQPEDEFEPEPEVEQTAFVAPRPRAPGTPSPEALERLRAAVNKAPRQAAGTERPQQPAAGQPQGEDARHGRFGIGTLINRMSGHGETPERPAHTARQQPPVYGRGQAVHRDEEELDPEQERIEIPAFLRRQAN